MAGDWSVLWLRGQNPDLRTALAPVVGVTGAPALVAFVLDSDCAAIEAQTPSGGRWTGVLNPAAAADSYEGMVESYDRPKVAVAGALRWSSEAGLTPSEDDLRKSLTEDQVFAEDLFDQLLKGLGVREPEKAS